MGFEFVYVVNKVDLYYMQVQGFGYVEYLDGIWEFFLYNGSNCYFYLSIEKYIMEQLDFNIFNFFICGICKFLFKNFILIDIILF